MTLTFIIKVIQKWFCNKAATIWHFLPDPLYGIYSSGWILSRFGRMIIHMKGYVARYYIWTWPTSSRSFSYDFIMNLLKIVHSAARTVLYEFFQYLAQMVTIMSWIPGWLESISIDITQNMMYAISRIHNGHKVVVCFRHATPSHYHHYAWLLACVEHEKCLPGISCRECV